MTRILAASDAIGLVTTLEAIDAMTAAFSHLEEEKLRMPMRVQMEVPGSGTHLTMPCLVGEDPGELAVKIVTVFPENRKQGEPTTRATLLYQDARTGKCLAIMNAEHLTALRTGAASGLATLFLAREDATKLTVFGAGGQATAQVEAVAAVRSLESVLVVSRDLLKQRVFCSRLQTKLGIPVSAARDREEAVSGADILCLATSSKSPLFDASLLRRGTHVNAIGSFRADMAELDPKALTNALVYVDDRAAARAGAGELIQGEQAGTFAFDRLAGTLGELVLGTCNARTNAEQITIFKSVGLAVQDVVLAGLIYRRAVERDIGVEVDFDN